MKVVFLQTGRTTDPHLAALCADYAARLAHYVPFEVQTLPDLRQTRSLSHEQQSAAEGEALLRFLSPADCLVLLDEHGHERRSLDFAAYVEKRLAAGHKRLVFAIGGPYGFSPAVRRRADDLVSLSQMTMSHQMVRLVFLEQLYRAMTILRGEPYHHE